MSLAPEMPSFDVLDYTVGVKESEKDSNLLQTTMKIERGLIQTFSSDRTSVID